MVRLTFSPLSLFPEQLNCACPSNPLSYLIGNKENNPGSSSFALTQLANSASIGKIIDSLEHILNLKGGPGYSFGTVMLPAILQVRSSLIWSNLTAKLVNPFAGAVKTEL